LRHSVGWRQGDGVKGVASLLSAYLVD